MSDAEECISTHTTRTQVLADVLSCAAKLALDLFEALPERLVSSKSAQDLVSDADQAVEQLIHKLLKSAFPAETIVGEEFGGEDHASFWIIDPIDGTANFLSGLPLWGISIAYVVDGEPVLGGISIPVLGYTAIGGPEFGLAFTGIRPRRDNAPCPAFGLGLNEHWDDHPRQAEQQRIITAGHAPVTLGSCAVSLFYVSTGRLAGYRENNIALWDCGAGIALCRAAHIPVRFEYRSRESVDIHAGHSF